MLYLAWYTDVRGSPARFFPHDKPKHSLHRRKWAYTVSSLISFIWEGNLNEEMNLYSAFSNYNKSQEEFEQREPDPEWLMNRYTLFTVAFHVPWYKYWYNFVVVKFLKDN